jgi:diguanylate cyclase (GGDEF)-like protein
MVWASAGLSLLVCYWMERHEQIGFLLLLHNTYQNNELASMNNELAQLSMLDALTGIPNRRAFDAEFRNAWETSMVKKQPLSLLMIDLDHFKQLNDKHGHAFGDIALEHVARTIRETLRGEQDIVARYGGEEFVALLPHQSLPQATRIAERLCATIRAAKLSPQVKGLEVNLTTSIGAASTIPVAGITPIELLRAADKALYEAKNRGRNQVWPQYAKAAS